MQGCPCRWHCSGSASAHNAPSPATPPQGRTAGIWCSVFQVVNLMLLALAYTCAATCCAAQRSCQAIPDACATLPGHPPACCRACCLVPTPPQHHGGGRHAADCQPAGQRLQHAVGAHRRVWRHRAGASAPGSASGRDGLFALGCAVGTAVPAARCRQHRCPAGGCLRLARSCHSRIASSRSSLAVCTVSAWQPKCHWRDGDNAVAWAAAQQPAQLGTHAQQPRPCPAPAARSRRAAGRHRRVRQPLQLRQSVWQPQRDWLAGLCM